jgi:hypothetical protein
MSPCHVSSGLRRITLTTPSILARSELVAQWAKAVNFVRHGDQDPVHVRRGSETRHYGVEVIGRHLHSVYDQPDAASVHAPFDRIVHALADELPSVADHLEQARADILTFTAYPKGAVAADLVQQPTGTSSTSAFFEPRADTNVILRRYATSYMIPEKRPFLARGDRSIPRDMVTGSLDRRRRAPRPAPTPARTGRCR